MNRSLSSHTKRCRKQKRAHVLSVSERNLESLILLNIETANDKKKFVLRACLSATEEILTRS